VRAELGSSNEREVGGLPGARRVPMGLPNTGSMTVANRQRGATGVAGESDRSGIYLRIP
jgi:hypothetical protein